MRLFKKVGPPTNAQREEKEAKAHELEERSREAKRRLEILEAQARVLRRQ